VRIRKQTAFVTTPARLPRSARGVHVNDSNRQWWRRCRARREHNATSLKLSVLGGEDLPTSRRSTIWNGSLPPVTAPLLRHQQQKRGRPVPHDRSRSTARARSSWESTLALVRRLTADCRNRTNAESGTSFMGHARVVAASSAHLMGEPTASTSGQRWTEHDRWFAWLAHTSKGSCPPDTPASRPATPHQHNALSRSTPRV
jgi:hypothetical protein